MEQLDPQVGILITKNPLPLLLLRLVPEQITKLILEGSIYSMLREKAGYRFEKKL